MSKAHVKAVIDAAQSHAGGRYTGGSMNAHGYIAVYDRATGRVRLAHQVIWEVANAQPIPDGKVVSFADGDRTNYTPDNLVLTTRAGVAHATTTYPTQAGQLTKVCRRCGRALAVTADNWLLRGGYPRLAECRTCWPISRREARAAARGAHEPPA